MSLKSIFNLGIVAVIATLSLSAAVQANPPTAFAIAGDNTANWDANFTGGVGGVLSINVPSGFLKSKINCPVENPDVSINFTPLPGVGAGGYFFVPGTNGFELILGGGAFTVTDNITGVVLLKGNFPNAILHGVTGTSAASLTVYHDTVTYTTILPAYTPPVFVANNGTFSMEFVTKTPIIANAGGPAPFAANDGITFRNQ